MEENKNISSKDLFKQYLSTRRNIERTLSPEERVKLDSHIKKEEEAYIKKKEKQRTKYKENNEYKQKVIENARKNYERKKKVNTVKQNKAEYEKEYKVLDLESDEEDNNNHINHEESVEEPQVIKKTDYSRWC
jgi:hypothetical protein